MPRAAPGSARSVRAAGQPCGSSRPTGRRQARALAASPLLHAVMGNSAASALREANGGSSDAACSADVAGCSCGNGAPAARPRRAGASAALPVLSLASAPRTPALSRQSLAEEIVRDDGRHIRTRTDRAGRVAFAAQLVVGRLDRGPRDAPALRQAARGRQARAGRQRARARARGSGDRPRPAWIRRRAAGRRQVQAGFLARADAGGVDDVAGMFMAAALACPFLLAGRQRRSACGPDPARIRSEKWLAQIDENGSI